LEPATVNINIHIFADVDYYLIPFNPRPQNSEGIFLYHGVECKTYSQDH